MTSPLSSATRPFRYSRRPRPRPPEPAPADNRAQLGTAERQADERLDHVAGRDRPQHAVVTQQQEGRGSSAARMNRHAQRVAPYLYHCRCCRRFCRCQLSGIENQALFYRGRRAAYGPFAYWTASFVAALPLIAVNTLAFSAPLYFMAGLNGAAGRFLFFLVIQALCNLVFSLR